MAFPLRKSKQRLERRYQLSYNGTYFHCLYCMSLICVIILILLIMPKPKRYKGNPCVYVVQTTYKGKPLYKIGYSANFPLRLRYIAKSFEIHGLPEPKVIKREFRRDAKQFEEDLHAKNKHRRCKDVPRTITGYTEYYRQNIYK